MGGLFFRPIEVLDKEFGGLSALGGRPKEAFEVVGTRPPRATPTRRSNFQVTLSWGLGWHAFLWKALHQVGSEVTFLFPP